MINETLNINVIYNPISGGNEKGKIIAYLKKKLSSYALGFHQTKYERHAFELATKFKDSSDIVIVIGGDGTVNEVGEALMYNNTKIWIIPSGSGNGLARSLRIPIHYKKNIDDFLNNRFTTILIDVIKVDEKFSFVTSGLGLDATVAYKFKKSSRGLLNYIKLTTTEFIKTQNSTYSLLIDEKPIQVKAIIVSICNSGQYGNNFYISNQSELDDGVMEVVIIKKAKNIFSNLAFLLRVLTKRLKKSKNYQLYQCRSLTVEHNNKYYHVDGEAYPTQKKKSTFLIKKGALQVLTP